MMNLESFFEFVRHHPRHVAFAMGGNGLPVEFETVHGTFVGALAFEHDRSSFLMSVRPNSAGNWYEVDKYSVEVIEFADVVQARFGEESWTAVWTTPSTLLERFEPKTVWSDGACTMSRDEWLHEFTIHAYQNLSDESRFVPMRIANHWTLLEVRDGKGERTVLTEHVVASHEAARFPSGKAPVN